MDNPPGGGGLPPEGGGGNNPTAILASSSGEVHFQGMTVEQVLHGQLYESYQRCT